MNQTTTTASQVLRCRSCDSNSLTGFLDLGSTPIASALLTREQLDEPEATYPLGLVYCADCSLVQLSHEIPADAVFHSDYPYFSSYADLVVSHGQAHARALVEERGLDSDSLVVEVACNDGYLLQAFVESGVPVLGIDPSSGPAEAARARGLPVTVEFFGDELATRLRSEGREADVVIANNVMAHVPDLNGFVAGLATMVSDDGVITIENASVKDLIEQMEFDTVYHEHYCYFSSTAVAALLRRHGLYLNRIEHFPDLHGGSLRWTASKRDDAEPSVGDFLAAERDAGVDSIGFYADFGARVSALQDDLRERLTALHADGARISGYGAADKGATLLNTLDLPPDVLDYLVDRNPVKQGRWMPGVRLPIHDPAFLAEEPPEYLLLLAWNFATEVMKQLEDYRRGGGRFILPVPRFQIVS